MRRWLCQTLSLSVLSALLVGTVGLQPPADAASKALSVKQKREQNLRDVPGAQNTINAVLARRPDLRGRVSYTGVTLRPLKNITGLRPRDPRNVRALLAAQKLRASRRAFQGTLPASWDLRKNIGSETLRIRNQENCGACWAFGSVAGLEGAFLFKSLGSKPDPSEQYVVNCATDPNGNLMGCDGGLPESALKLLQDTGAPTRGDLPYTGAAYDCADSNKPIVYRAAAYGYVDGMDETTGFPPGGTNAVVAVLKQALMDHGALVIGYRVGDGFQHSNITSEDDVFDIVENTPEGSDQANHCICLIGWDDTKGGGAWLINSWDTTWGAGGFMWVKYGINQIGQFALWVDAQGASTPAPAPAPAPAPPPAPGPVTPSPPIPPPGNDPAVDQLSASIRARLDFYRKNYPDYIPTN